MTDREVIVISDEEEFRKHESFLRNADVIAFDAEGHNLGRFGVTSLVQIATPRSNATYLFDVLHCSPSSPFIGLLRELLEDKAIVKVVHDCRIDSDALWHTLEIRLGPVHDTQAWHMALEQKPEDLLSLNDLLQLYKLPVNPHRDASVYASDPEFWLKRPMPRHMIERAAEDVAQLLVVHEIQAKKAMAMVGDAGRFVMEYATKVSQERLAALRDRAAKTVEVHETQAGRFVGREGANIRRFEKEQGVHFSSMGAGIFAMYAESPEALESACAAMATYQKEQYWQQIDIPKHFIPAFIGKEGAHVKELRKQTRCDITQKDTCTFTVRAGSKEDLDKGLRAIMEFISIQSAQPSAGAPGETGPQSDKKSPGAFVQHIDMPRHYVAAFIGKGGAHVKEVRQQTNCDIFQENKTNTFTVRAASKEDLNKGLFAIMQFISSQSAQSSIPSQEGEGGEEKGGHIQRVDIPREYVAAFIGKGGVHVKEVRQQTNCDIFQENKSNTFTVRARSKEDLDSGVRRIMQFVSEMSTQSRAQPRF
uniref:3'-5' exonuclease domain-containing protein n=1 Tax=Chromera velia CCMP2878 TaxID=1169474 RepID=A0A0G4ICW2_9ALVE|eukprot:Cvel_13168.t1-p1 / transcript=Cvel_13168.t1 / gene=Cvel_13168 / organism=Chromera_velia_CCMP2878 / gene_product=Exonuclease 3'-5' domain-containing protein 1, putative / transcript_product=Exonuclease 3'-5' domain-containing protein 1, putative / location=Cvel_scaffold889:15874-17472(+) / protein_length=533 / sequence_SO=supercontig / SO=protein_coding / is_pseudo=false